MALNAGSDIMKICRTNTYSTCLVFGMVLFSDK
jgi:hypothetical protein